jgi:glycosyltransferase involved in cell wall biosynthesis
MNNKKGPSVLLFNFQSSTLEAEKYFQGLSYALNVKLHQPLVKGCKATEVFEYENGRLIGTYTLGKPHTFLVPLVKCSKIFYLLIDFIDVLQCVLAVLVSRKKKFDICISLYNTQFCGAYFLKKIGLVKKNIFFIYDYYLKDNFQSGAGLQLVQRLYRMSLRSTIKKCDALWLLSPHMLLSPFLKRLVEDHKKTVYAFETAGCDDLGDKFISRLKEGSDRNGKKCIGFLGNLNPYHGIDLILEVLPDVVKSIPRVVLKIIGSGPEEKRLKALVREKRLEDHVVFLGHVASKEEVYRTLGGCAVGLATYNPDSCGINYKYLGPGKTREYMAVGLPTIITKGAYFADVIEKHRAGFSIEYSAPQLLSVLLKFLKDDTRIREYRENMRMCARNYRYDTVLRNAVAATLSAWQGRQP